MGRRLQMVILPVLIIPALLLVGLVTANVLHQSPQSAPASSPAAAAPAAAVTAAPLAVVSNATPVPTLSPALTGPIDSQDALLTKLYRERSPAVVTIKIVGNSASGQSGRSPLALPTVQPAPSAGPSDSQPGPPTDQNPGLQPGFVAEGSGFLVDGDRHIVTNNHVVEGASDIEVTWTDGSIVEAKVVGVDLDADLAVIQADKVPNGVQPLPLGDSRAVEVGQRAIAIGNPFGLGTTLTMGIVSARGRLLPNQADANGNRFFIADIIQTDATINPGNSGGPLLNSRGEVVGINTAIRTDTGTFQGVGYAVPANMVKKVIPELIKHGQYQHPFLGLLMDPTGLSETTAKQLGLNTTHGVGIDGVAANSPVQQAGIHGSSGHRVINGAQYSTGGDVVLKINDKVVNQSADIIDYLATDTEVGQTVTLTVLRDGKEVPVQVKIGARPHQP
ncbi:MAG: trypsin-like peptidase domain-containing protein [Herpetosiphonaceae bacterium]|nr:trypsin-like peptidase domain-containing protein [Herpetosiphonaceae bacterium]